MYVYHYTSFEKWPKTHSSCLQPISRQSLSSELGLADAPKATFALLEPEPKAWTNDTFPTLWNEFKGTRGDLLIRVNIGKTGEDVLVGDAGYVEGYLYRDYHDELHIPEEYKIHDPGIAYRKYQESLTQIGKYQSEGHSFLLPEVQIRVPIPGSMLEICRRQPLLESQLGNGNFPDTTIHPLPSIHKHQQELSDWLETTAIRFPYLKHSLLRYEAEIHRPNPEL